MEMHRPVAVRDFFGSGPGANASLCASTCRCRRRRCCTGSVQLRCLARREREAGQRGEDLWLAGFWRETKDPEGVQQDSPGRKPWVKVQIAESPERAAQGVRSQLQINARHKAPLWYRDQLHRPFGASLVTVLLPRACALGFPESPLRG